MKLVKCIYDYGDDYRNNYIRYNQYYLVLETTDTSSSYVLFTI
jgi:hypothetical protein